MAKANLNKRPIPQPRYEVEVDLTLSAEEATFLKALMNLIGGDPNNSLRAYADSIGTALHDVGVLYWTPASPLARPGSDTIFFRDGSVADATFVSEVAKLRS